MGSLASWTGTSRGSALHKVKGIGDWGLTSYSKEQTLRLFLKKNGLSSPTCLSPQQYHPGKLRKKGEKEGRFTLNEPEYPHLPTRHVCPSPPSRPAWGARGLEDLAERKNTISLEPALS